MAQDKYHAPSRQPLHLFESEKRVTRSLAALEKWESIERYRVKNKGVYVFGLFSC